MGRPNAYQQHGQALTNVVLENAYPVAKEVLVDEGPVSLTKKQVAYIVCMNSRRIDPGRNALEHQG